MFVSSTPRSLSLSVALFLIALVASVCAQTASLEKPLIAVPSPALSMLPVFFAQDRGLFKKEGIEPVIVTMAGRLRASALQQRRQRQRKIDTKHHRLDQVSIASRSLRHSR